MEHGLLVENLLDLAHAPFTHTTTFARGWPVRVSRALRSMREVGLRCSKPRRHTKQQHSAAPTNSTAPPRSPLTHPLVSTCDSLQVPDAVKFHASRLMGGNWDPYPIEMWVHRAAPCCGSRGG